MHSIDLLSYVSENIPFTYYVNSFPATAPAECGVVRITGGSSPGKAITRPSFQVLIRASHPSLAEAKAWEVYEFFSQKRNFDVGMTHVIFCNAAQSTPLYIGVDDNGRTIYSTNFITIAEVL